MACRHVACVIGDYCREHGFIHGAEAEELRERLSKLNNAKVNAVLDDVDARDSCAYLERGDDHGQGGAYEADGTWYCARCNALLGNKIAAGVRAVLVLIESGRAVDATHIARLLKGVLAAGAK
jgi:hypothetical protein